MSADLRALLAAAFNAVLPLRTVGQLHAEGNNWGIEDVNGFDVAGDLYQADAEAIVAAVNGAGPLLDELEALRSEGVIATWRAATGCDTPEEAGEEMALTQHGHDQWYDEVKRWRTATGCDSPDDVHAQVAAELALLRELERTVLEHRRACEEESGPVAADDTDEQMYARIERLNRLGDAEDAAIAACRAAKEATDADR